MTEGIISPKNPFFQVRFLLVLGFLSVLLVFLFAMELLVGSVRIPWSEVLNILGGMNTERESWENIIINFRLPKAVVAILAGSSLSVAGLMMQTLFRNPLAGPDVLGLSAGAGLGVALVILTAGATTTSTILGNFDLFGSIGVAFAASAGSALVLILILLASHRIRSSITILILGLMVGYATSSLVTVLMNFALAERIQAYIVWSFGSFGGCTWSQIQVLALFTLFGLVCGGIMVKQLNVLLLGELYAESMGLNFRLTRIRLFVATALLAGSVTAFCGPIGFIGISVPHLCRSLFSTSNHMILVPGCILIGACLALVSDIIASVPGSDITLPLNAVTSLIGAPIVIWVIFSKTRKDLELCV